MSTGFRRKKMKVEIEEGKCKECGRPLPIGIYLCRACKFKKK